jgi:ATP-binding cassette subfamily B protein
MTTTSDTGRAAPAREENALPELRSVWWEGGVRARAEATIAAVLAELPKLVQAAFQVSWRASQARTATTSSRPAACTPKWFHLQKLGYSDD